MLEILINNNSNCYNNNNNNNYNNNNNNYNNNNNNSNYDNYKLEKNSNCWTCSPSPTTLDLIFSITYEHYWILATKKMICHWVSLFQTMQMLIISDCCVAEHGLWNAQKKKKRTWWAIVPLSSSLIWLLILPSSRYKFPCKLVMRIWR